MRWTARSDGHLGTGCPEERRRALVDRPWAWFRQVHGARTVAVGDPRSLTGQAADAGVSSRRDVALAVFTADCAPVALASEEGVIGIVHAGWKGLVAGVIGAAVATMRKLGATTVSASLGPCIHPECYEFGDEDLDIVAGALGDAVRGMAATGRCALDLPAAVGIALERAGAVLADDAGACTACAVDDSGRPVWFSHRARRDESRQATVVWLP